MVGENNLTEEELQSGPLMSHIAEEQVGKKVDLGCGSNLRPGYVGVDSVSLEDLIKYTPEWEGEAPEAYQNGNYVQQNLLEFPWVFEESSLAATYASHFVEHIPHSRPGWDPDIDGWWLWFTELYRVLEDGGVAEFFHPFSRSDRAFWDPTHTRFIHYQTWMYLQKKERIALGVNHYAPEIDFEIMSIQSVHEPTLLDGRSSDVIEFARQFYFNPTDDLFVVIRAIKS